MDIFPIRIMIFALYLHFKILLFCFKNGSAFFFLWIFNKSMESKQIDNTIIEKQEIKLSDSSLSSEERMKNESAKQKVFKHFPDTGTDVCGFIRSATNFHCFKWKTRTLFPLNIYSFVCFFFLFLSRLIVFIDMFMFGIWHFSLSTIALWSDLYQHYILF